MTPPAALSHASPAPRWLVGLQRRAGRPGFVPLSAAVTALDGLLPVLPSTSLLVAVVWLRPERWRIAAVWFAIAGGWGAAILATLAAAAGRALGDGAVMEGIPWVEAAIRDYGLPVLFMLALVPWPVRTAIVAAALGGLPAWQIAGTVFAARLIAFGVLAALTAWAPARLARFRPFAWVSPVPLSPAQEKRQSGD